MQEKSSSVDVKDVTGMLFVALRNVHQLAVICKGCVFQNLVGVAVSLQK